MRRALLAVAAISMAAASLTAAPAQAGAAEPAVTRVAGDDRYETAVAVARLLHPGSAETVVIATGTGFADALAAGVAAAALESPLLLAAPGHVPDDALRGLGPDRVVLVGGTAAIPTAVEAEIALSTGATVERLAGTDRFETARAVADATAPDATHTFAAGGLAFESALVAATHAAREGGRLVLSPSMPPGVVSVDGEAIAGGPAVVNRELLERFPATSDTPVVTTLDAFPDALSATTLGAALDAPVLFTGAASAGTTTLDVFNALDPTRLIVVGGTAAVSETVLQQLFGWLPLPPEVADGAESAIARDVFERINDERTARGLAPLVWDQAIAASAAAWAREMSVSGYRNAPLDSGQGENIDQVIPYCVDGACSFPTSGVVHRDWMRSAGHRDNVLEPGYVAVGVGVFCDDDGTLWAVEQFAVAFGPVSAGGSPPDPIVHDTTSGVTCAGEVVGDQPWWPDI